MHRFEDDVYYAPGDNALRLLATRATLALWRHQNKGPAYSKFGRRVYYLGADLNSWCDARRVEPRAA